MNKKNIQHKKMGTSQIASNNNNNNKDFPGALQWHQNIKSYSRFQYSQVCPHFTTAEIFNSKYQDQRVNMYAQYTEAANLISTRLDKKIVKQGDIHEDWSGSM